MFVHQSAGVLGVRAVPVPAQLRAAAGLLRPDFADAFAARLPLGAPQDVDHWHRAVLCSGVPAWVGVLVRVRGVLASALRLRTARPGADNAFPVLSRTQDVVVAGADDRHLDFRAVLALRTAADGATELLVVTVVQRHNAVGRAYFALITPFHRRVVPAMLSRAVCSGGPAAGDDRRPRVG